ncbi:DUF6275 family protein [Streptococcaceae bacterium ESL0729]|nr:DUF6275 family protein [Streptococcaceae bacterium ESL0729]
MNTEEFIEKVKKEISNYVRVTEREDLVTPEDIYTVWYCKTIQNHKGLFGTP